MHFESAKSTNFHIGTNGNVNPKEMHLCHIVWAYKKFVKIVCLD